jgi:hypothetical protein
MIRGLLPPFSDSFTREALQAVGFTGPRQPMRTRSGYSQGSFTDRNGCRWPLANLTG